MLSLAPELKERIVLYIQHHLWTETQIGRTREGEIKTRGRASERLVSHEREESKSKVKGGNMRTNNTESSNRGARGTEGAIEREKERGSGKMESSTTA